MNTQYTSGPWKNIDGRIFSDYFISKTPIATIHKSKRATADSALITAAPELLEALEALQTCMISRSTVEGDLIWTSDVIRAMKIANSAIAKARGV